MGWWASDRTCSTSLVQCTFLIQLMTYTRGMAAKEQLVSDDLIARWLCLHNIISLNWWACCTWLWWACSTSLVNICASIKGLGCTRQKDKNVWMWHNCGWRGPFRLFHCLQMNCRPGNGPQMNCPTFVADDFLGNHCPTWNFCCLLVSFNEPTQCSHERIWEKIYLRRHI